VFQLKHFHVKQFAVYFGIKVSIKDLAILQTVRAFFGDIGRVYPIKVSSEGPVKDPRFFYFRVNRATDLAEIVAHFDRYPLTASKAHQYQVWREMVRLKQRFRRPDTGRLAELASQLSDLTRTSPAQS
jgi:LAGLIDADG endonuclease